MSDATVSHPEQASWPLVHVRAQRVADVSSTEGVLCQLERALDRDERICLLLDYSLTHELSLASVKAFADFAQRRGRALDRLVTAMAVVAPSAQVQCANRVLFTLRCPQHPWIQVEDLEAAFSYLEPFVAELNLVDDADAADGANVRTLPESRPGVPTSSAA